MPSKESLARLSARLAGIRILIADTDTQTAELVRDMFKQMGFEQIEIVDQENAAHESLRRNQVDIVITEWAGQSLDGIELIKNLRTAADSPDKRVPIIMLTGHGEKHNVEAARDAGVTDFLVKPFHPRSLIDRLVTVIETPREFVISKNFKGPTRRRRPEKDGEGNKRSKTPPTPKMFITHSEETQASEGNGTFIIIADDSLKKRLGTDVNIGDLLLPEMIQKVEQVIAEHRPQFMKSIHADFSKIEQAFTLLSKDLAQIREQSLLIQNQAITIKSQAGIFGYTLASEVARLLYNYIEKEAEYDENFIIVIKQFVDALRSIFQLAIEGDGGMMGSELLQSLHKLMKKYRP